MCLKFVDSIGWERNGRRKVEVISDTSRCENLVIIQNRLLLTLNTERNFPDVWPWLLKKLQQKKILHWRGSTFLSEACLWWWWGLGFGWGLDEE